jgi:hypothetical protein
LGPRNSSANFAINLSQDDYRKTAKTSVHEFMDFMILNVCPLLPPCPVLAVPFLRRMHWFAAKLFLESFSVGLFSKHEHPIVLILPGDKVTVAREEKFTLPAEVPELVVVLPDALVFVERYPEREVLIRPAEYAR